MARVRFVATLVKLSGANPKNLWVGYLVGLSLLTFLVATTYLLNSWNVEVIEKHAKISLLASRQSVKVHSIFENHAGEMAYEQYEDTRHLKRMIASYRENTKQIKLLLQEPSKIDDIIFSENYSDLLRDLNTLLDCLIVLTMREESFPHVMNSEEDKTMQGNDVPSRPFAFSNQNYHGNVGIEELKILHNELVAFFSSREQKATEFARKINRWSFITIIALLFLETIFIFLPAHMISQRYYLRNKQQKHKMKSLMKDLSKQNTEIRKAYERIGYDALHDSLTGLANRRFLKEELQRRVHESEETHKKLAIFHIDLDKFKQINDSLGHKAGDFVLTCVAERLKKSLQSDDFVARIGGDEFAILSESKANHVKLTDLAENLTERLRQPVLFEGVRCDVSASIGIDVVNLGNAQERPDVSNFLSKADLALYQVKERGGGGFELFSDEIMASHLANLNLQDEITNAISGQEFIPYYQLQYDAKSREIVSAEALVRWRHPSRGIVQPGHFLEQATQMGYGQQIDHMVMKGVLSDLAVWKLDRHCPIKSVAVNLSANTIGDPLFMRQLSKLNIPPGCLSFEITETVDINKHSTQIIENVEWLKHNGFDVEIDDFGTGHASILCLQYLKPKRLKIDREFIFPIVEDQEQRALVKSIIDLSRPFDVKVVAEGVESLEHADILAEMGCDILQGFALCKPIPSVGVTALLNKKMDVPESTANSLRAKKAG